jgi:hypothetical protein
MATKLGFRRFLATILAAAGLAASHSAEAGGNWMPLLPDQDFYDFQLFAPPDLNEYGIYQEAHDGIFFSYDRTYMGITPPRFVPVGNTTFWPVEPLNADVAQQLNTANGGFAGVVIYGTDQMNLALNTTWLRTKMTWGNRYEGGWIYDDYGMLFSYWDSGPQDQSFETINEYALNSPVQTFDQETATSTATIGGNAQPIVTTTIETTSPPPDHLISQTFTQHNQTRLQSGAAAWIVRRALGRRGSGSTVRLGLGPRFVQLADRYNIGYQSYQYPFNAGSGTTDTGTTGTGTGASGQGGVGDVGGTVTSGGSGILNQQGDVVTLTGVGQGTKLQDGNWETYTSNNIVGPEISMLLEANSGRWKFLTELKFTAGMNWQNMLYRGSNFPATLAADYFRTEFTTATVLTQDGTANNQQTIQGDPLYIQVYGAGQKNASNDAEHVFQFTPIGEWRLGTEFRVSQAILLRAGYTGMWMGQIARASSNTAYITTTDNVQKSIANPNYDPNQPTDVNNPITVVADVPVEYSRIGPAPTAIQDYVFTNGIDFGIEVKY